MPPRASIPPRPVPQRVASRTEGPNFDVELRADGIGRVRVWRRPDLSRDEGAHCAQQLAEHMHRLALGARACIFDMTRAAPTWGPVTHQALLRMLLPWEAAAKPIYIIIPEEAITRILLRELQREAAPTCGKLVASEEMALTALEGSGKK